MISIVRSILSQCNTRLRLLYLLYDIEVMWQKTIKHAFPMFYMIKYGFLPNQARVGSYLYDKKALTMDTLRWIPNSTLGEVHLMTDLREIEALTYGFLNNKDSPMIVTLEETVTRPMLLFAAHVIIPMSLNSVLGMISVSF